MNQTDIRVHTDRVHRSLYNDLRNLAVGDMHELFFICVCLGYRREKKKPLGKSREQRFYSRTFTADEFACFCAMMLEQNNMDFRTIQDQAALMAEMEEYANGGMEVLIQECLADYVADGAGEVTIEKGRFAAELPKTLLAYLEAQV